LIQLALGFAWGLRRMRGPAWRALLLVLALAVADVATARFVVEKNSLQVTSPKGLKGKHECAIGNFGVPQYGGTLQGWVEYPKSNRKACQTFDQFDISFKPKAAGGRPNFVLIDRGGAYHSVSPFFLFPSVLASIYPFSCDFAR
jgi:hypothetical protein